MKKKTTDELILEIQQQLWNIMISRKEPVDKWELERVRDDIKSSFITWNIFLCFFFCFILMVTYG